MVYKSEANQLAVRNYTKSTDCNSYLEYNSFHPKKLKQNLPYGQFFCVKRNSSEPVEYDKSANLLQHQLKNRGYPVEVLQLARQRTDLCKRQELLTESAHILFALDFTPQTYEIQRIVRRHWHLLHMSPDLRNYLGRG